MRNPAAALLLLALAATASAETTIGFNVKLTDARTALLANPQFSELKISDEQLEKAAKDRVLLLDDTSGTKWTWLILSWPAGRDVEHGLKVSGVGAIGKDADVALEPVDAHTVQVRCLHEQCVLTAADETVTLKKDQTHAVAFGSDVKVAF